MTKYLLTEISRLYPTIHVYREFLLKFRVLCGLYREKQKRETAKDEGESEFLQKKGKRKYIYIN